MKIFIVLFNILFLTPTIRCEMLDSSFDADFYGDIAEFFCQDNFCNILDLIGPPPDILDIPPPPIPSFLKGLNIINDSDNLNSDKCNYCNQFTDQIIDGLSFTLPKQAPVNFLNNSLTISIGLSVILIIFLIALYVKYKKMKISLIDTCASFSHNFFFKNKDIQVSSRVDNCAPVVNEKTQQSIITNSPSKKSTIIPAKYWKTPTGNGINFAHQNNHHLMSNEFNGSLLVDNTMTTEMGEYMPEEGSCTSSPVYQELCSNNHQINLDNMSNLITLNNLNNLNPLNSQARYNSYTMRNYSEIPNSMKISQLNQLNQINPDSALLPEVSYDNEAYLPSSNSDYHNKSLKRNHRQSTFSGSKLLGSKTPLLSSHCPTNVNHSLTLGYLNNEKPKLQTFIQHQQIGGRINVNNTLMLKNQDQDQINIQPRYIQQGNKKNILIYNGQPIISSNNFNTQQRPLPKLPNNFI